MKEAKVDTFIAAKSDDAQLVTESPKKALTIMVTVTVIFIALAAAYNVLTPYVTPAHLNPHDGAMANPDEHEHFRYIQTLLQTHRLPHFELKGNTEGHQPPLYYLLCAAITPNGLDISFAAHISRIISTVLGVATLWFAYLTARELFPRRAVLAAYIAATAVLTPMFVSLSAAVNNDAAANAAFAAAFWQIARLSRRVALAEQNRASWNRQVALLGLILAAGIYSKMSAALLFVAVLAFWLLEWRSKSIDALVARNAAALSLGLGLLLSAPWLIRNQILYGDPLGTSAFVKVLAANNFSPQQIISQLGAQWYWTKMVTWTYQSYWGFFDSMNLPLPAQFYELLALISLVGLVGFGVYLFRDRHDDATKAVFATMGLVIAGVFVAFAQYNVHFFQAQGRYFFPALVPLTIILVVGVTSLAPPRYRELIAAGLVTLLVILNIAVLGLIQPYYHAVAGSSQ